MQKYLILGLSLFLSACSTVRQDMDNGLSAMPDKHIDTLISKIGFPTGEREIAGRKLYVWDVNHTVSYALPTTSSTTGTMNTFGLGGNAFGTYSGTTTNWIPQVSTYHCTINVEVDDADIILTVEYSGNSGGCKRYAAALRP